MARGKKKKKNVKEDNRFPRIKKHGHVKPVSNAPLKDEEGELIDMRKPRVKKGHSHGKVAIEIMRASANRRRHFDSMTLLPGEKSPSDLKPKKDRKPVKKAAKKARKKAAKKAAKKRK